MIKPWFVALTSAVMGSVLSISLVGRAQPAKTPSAVAYVSANRVLTDTTHGRSEVARIQALQQQRTSELRTKQQALDTVRQQLAQASDPATKGQLQQQEQQQRADLDRASQQAQADLSALQREVNTDLQQRVKAALDEILKTQPYQLVLNADTSLMWAAPEMDLTSAVVSRLNAR